jgi:hypothetical protein
VKRALCIDAALYCIVGEIMMRVIEIEAAAMKSVRCISSAL